MSKYLDHIGQNLPKHANQEEYGAWYDIINPFTAFDYYKKRGVTSLPGDFIQELRIMMMYEKIYQTDQEYFEELL